MKDFDELEWVRDNIDRWLSNGGIDVIVAAIAAFLMVSVIGFGHFQ